MTKAATTSTSSLYDRLGGGPGVSDLVVEFYERVLHDPVLSPFFHHTSMERLHRMQREFFTLATGGPTTTTAFDLAEAHLARHIGEEQYRHFVQHLIDTLEHRGLDDGDIEAMTDRLALERNSIVSGPGDID